MNFLELPPHIWAWSSAIIGTLVAAVTGWIGHLVGSRKNRQDGLSQLVDQLQQEVARLAARVEALERHRDAYRDWSIVLWEWGSDVQTDESPRPSWPDGLPR